MFIIGIFEADTNYIAYEKIYNNSIISHQFVQYIDLTYTEHLLLK
jgi:hypothetical protein